MRPLPEGIEVRRAGRADAEPVSRLVRAGIESYREWAGPDWEVPEAPEERHAELRELFGGDEAWILMAFDSDELVGVVSISPTTGAAAEPPPPGTIYLWQMFVAPRLQGSGLAVALLDRALDEARSRGFTRLTLWAAEGAAQARRFYEREGWTLTGANRMDVPFGLRLVEYERLIDTTLK
jgi:GNAT superfamily N-acetyltransferase